MLWYRNAHYGSALHGSASQIIIREVYSIDIDDCALNMLNETITMQEATHITVQQKDAETLIKEFIAKFDIILINPPFGTKKEDIGIDMHIITLALQYLKPTGRIYSFHKTSTIDVNS